MPFPPPKAAPRPPQMMAPGAPPPMAAPPAPPPAPPPMPPQATPAPGGMEPGADPGADPGVGDFSQRMAQLTADDISALQNAPEALDVIKRLLPEIADELDTVIDPNGTDGEQQDDNANRGPDEPNYSLPRPSTRLGQMT